MTNDTRPRTSTSSSRPGSEVLQKMQSVLAPPEPVTYALLHGAHRRSMRGWVLVAGCLGTRCQLLGLAEKCQVGLATSSQLPSPTSYRQGVGRWNRGRSALRRGRLLVDQFLQ